MSEATWDRLLSDPRVSLGPLANSRSFKNFIEEIVPKIISGYSETVASFEIWIEIQYHIARAWADLTLSRQNENIAISLSGYQDKEFFLMVHNKNERDYALQVRGLYFDEYAEMKDGSLIIGDLFEQNPVAFIGPLLKKNDIF